MSKERKRVCSRGYDSGGLAAEELAVLDTTERMLRNLYAVAIYHILEQHLIEFFYRQAVTASAKTLTRADNKKQTDNKKPDLYNAIQKIKDAWGIDLKNISSWDAIDKIRRVANCIKHGDGPDCKKLKKNHADWFDGEFITPLSGEGLKLPKDYLDKAVGDIEKFLSEFTHEIEKVEM